MIRKLVLAVVVAVVVTLACMLLGVLLAALQLSVAVIIGHFLTDWAGVIGILAGIWYYFAG